jgi:hypothetical protein
MDDVAEAMQPFADELRHSTHLLRNNISSIRATTEKYDGDAEYDLVHLAENAALRGGSPKLARLAGAVESAVRDSVIYSDAWTRVGDEPAEHANGLSIWFPSNGALPQYRELAFAADTGWDRFLDAYSSYSIPPTYSTNLSAHGTDADGDGAVDGIEAVIETDAPGNVVFEFVCDGNVTEMEVALASGQATAALEDAPFGEYEVAAYVYDSLDRLMALAVSPVTIAVEAWLYVNGTVADDGGHPIEGALVEVGWGGGWRLNATTGPDGAYSVRILCPTQFSNGTLTAIAMGESASSDASGPGELRLDLVVEAEAEPFSWLPAIGLMAVGIYCAILAIAWSRGE